MDNKDKKISEDYRSKTFINEIDLDMITEFHLSDVKDLIHLLTVALKQKGVAEPFVILPFKPQNDDKKVSFFLQKILQNLHNNEILNKHISRAESFVLFTALKFLWCRLPGSFVIGWKVYDRFRNSEKRAGYPKHAFAELFPLCFDDFNHASITYDFIDLMAKLSANAATNMLDGRRIARMFSLYAFPKLPDSNSHSASNDSNSFTKGLSVWLSGVDSTFHLLQAFIRSMLPKENDIKQKVGMQLSLQSLLTNYRYPPSSNLTNSNSILSSVPLITIYSNTRSENPAELLKKTIDLISFEKPEEFTGTEIYLSLKYLFKKDSDADQKFQKAEYDKVLSRLSPLSQKIINQLSSEKNYYLLKYGWYRSENFVNNRISTFDSIKISSVPIDDSYIWTWMSSLSPEAAIPERSLFGRSIIAEFNFSNSATKDKKHNNQCIVIQEINTHSDQKISNSSLEVTHESLSEYDASSSPSTEGFPVKDNVSVIYSSRSSVGTSFLRHSSVSDPKAVLAPEPVESLKSNTMEQVNGNASQQCKTIISSPLSTIPAHLQDEHNNSSQASDALTIGSSSISAISNNPNPKNEPPNAHFTFVNLEDDDDELFIEEDGAAVITALKSSNLSDRSSSHLVKEQIIYETSSKSLINSSTGLSKPSSVNASMNIRSPSISAAYNGPLSPPPSGLPMSK